MPRDNDKDNDSRGRRDRPSATAKAAPAARAARARRRGPEKKFAKRGFAGKSDGDKRDGERRPYAGKPDGARSFDKKPYAGGASPTPASATAIVRRAAISTRRARRVATGRSAIAARAVIVRHASTAMTVPVATGRLPAVRPVVTTVKSARSSRARTVAARSARTRRAATARTSIATTVRRAGTARAALGIATMPVRPRALARRNSARSGPIRRAKVAARSGRTRRAAKVSARTATVPRGDRAGAEIRRRQEILLAWRARPRPAQELWRSCRPRQFKAVAEARGSRRARCPSRPRWRAQFRQAALRPSPRRSRRRRASALLAFARGSSRRRSSEI